MNKFLFSVSIKGILQYNHQYLLRKNQRHEYELLGGRLELLDTSISHRLRVEFLEESQIFVKELFPREPWLYICGIKNIIILPYICSISKTPPKIIRDLDGGELKWFHYDELKSLPLPRGYIDSIYGIVPHKTYSPYVGKYPKIIPDYKESLYKVQINLYNIYHAKIFSKYLEHFLSPREMLSKYLGSNYLSDNIVSTATTLSNDTIELNYVLLIPYTKEEKYDKD